MDFFSSDPRRIIYLWLGLLSLVLFIMMGSDKSRARKGIRRIPEKSLFIFALLGGALGGWLAMYTFRHKTRHWYFVVGFPLIAVIQLGLCLYCTLI